MSGRRRLDDDERSLWREVTRSIKPLRNRPPDDAAEAPAVETAAATESNRPARKAVLPAKPVREPPSLAPLDKKYRRKLIRGSEPLEMRLDLHGRTQQEAYAALMGFLRRAQAEGARTVLVITGKGLRGAGERGVLRRQVPHWLGLPEFRALVVGFEDAHVGHGGEGALYVRIRRVRPQP